MGDISGVLTHCVHRSAHGVIQITIKVHRVQTRPVIRSIVKQIVETAITDWAD
jgi:hypothetical protein